MVTPRGGSCEHEHWFSVVVMWEYVGGGDGLSTTPANPGCVCYGAHFSLRGQVVCQGGRQRRPLFPYSYEFRPFAFDKEVPLSKLPQ